jgi:DNA-binding NarL/FixJ family response regulator
LHALALLISRDRGLINSVVESSEAESLTIEYVDRLAEATDRVKLHDAIQALVVDLGQFDRHELEALRVLMHAAPNIPVLVLGDDDDLARHAALLAQGAQDLLLKSNLDGGALRRAVRNAMARKAREVAVFNDNERARVAHCLHLQVVAEGVETLQQLQFLKAHDCGEGQGYYFSKPVDPGECQSLLQRTEPRRYGFRPPALRAVK